MSAAGARFFGTPRALRAAAVALLATGALIGPRPASAASVELVWTGTTGAGATGSPAIVVSDTAVETLTLDVQLEVDSRRLSGLGLSLHFDADLQDELDVLSFQELSWNGPGSQLLQQVAPNIASSQESSAGGARGQLYTFEGWDFGPGPKATTLTFARVVFTTNPTNVALDGGDVASGFFAPDGSGSDDGWFDGTEPVANDLSSSVSLGAAHVGPVGDSDGDGIDDFLDNCLLAINAEQIDSDGDGCGNACDADYDQNGATGITDFAIFKSSMGRFVGQPGYVPHADHTANDAVGIGDFSVYRAFFGKAPGPSLNPLRDPFLCQDS